MKDEICQFFQKGRCRYGNTCSKQHITISELLDPPTWIFTKIDYLNLNVISQEEVRYSLKVNDTRKILDDMWIENYTEMYTHLNMLCKKGTVKSVSKRCIDLRKHPECFNLPFDLEYVESKIIKLREDDPICDGFEILVGSEDETIGDIDVENAPTFIKEYAYKSEAKNVSNNEREINTTRYNKGVDDGNEMINNKVEYQSNRDNYQQRNYINRDENVQHKNIYQQRDSRYNNEYQQRDNTYIKNRDNTYIRKDNRYNNNYQNRDNRYNNNFQQRDNQYNREDFKNRDNTYNKNINKDNRYNQFNREDNKNKSNYNTRTYHQQRDDFQSKVNYNDNRQRDNFAYNREPKNNLPIDNRQREFNNNRNKDDRNINNKDDRNKNWNNQSRDWNKSNVSLNNKKRDEDEKDFDYQNIPYNYQ